MYLLVVSLIIKLYPFKAQYSYLLRLLAALAIAFKNPYYLYFTCMFLTIFRIGNNYFYTQHLPFGVWEIRSVDLTSRHSKYY